MKFLDLLGIGTPRCTGKPFFPARNSHQPMSGRLYSKLPNPIRLGISIEKVCKGLATGQDLLVVIARRFRSPYTEALPLSYRGID